MAGGHPPASSMSRSAASNLCFIEICVILKITSCSCAFTCLFGAQKNPSLFRVGGFLFKTELPMC